MGRWCSTSSVVAAGPATGLFPPQERDWALPHEAQLSPKAARRIAREAACQSFDNAARALNQDWGTSLDGKQVQRWAEKLGQTLVEQQQNQVQACERGDRPEGAKNDPQLLVIGMDGGRVQGIEKNPDTNSRWKEDKVLTISSYLKSTEPDKPPTPLVTSYLATMENAQAFGPMARTEAERRGIRQAACAVVIGDGGNWIDPLCEKHFAHCPRIIDYYHAAEHLHEVARAVYGGDDPRATELADQLKGLLYDGRVDEVIGRMKHHQQHAGPPSDQDAATHPRRVLQQNIGYFTTHRGQMNYPEYRRRGWPIGSGVTESGVKLMNKRVKGSEQFWHERNVETMLALRCLWLSQDQRWQHYWLGSRVQGKAA